MQPVGEVPGFKVGRVTLTVTASPSPGAADVNVISCFGRAKGPPGPPSLDITKVLGSALNRSSFVPGLAGSGSAGAGASRTTLRPTLEEKNA